MMCQDEHFDIFETTAIFKICEYHLLLRLRWIKRNKILIKCAMELEISIILENIDQSSYVTSAQSCQKESCKDRPGKSF